MLDKGAWPRNSITHDHVRFRRGELTGRSGAGRRGNWRTTPADAPAGARGKSGGSRPEIVDFCGFLRHDLQAWSDEEADGDRTAWAPRDEGSEGTGVPICSSGSGTRLTFSTGI